MKQNYFPRPAVFCGASCAVLWGTAVRPVVVCGAFCGGLRFSDLPPYRIPFKLT